MSRDIKFRAWNVRRFLRDEEYAVMPNGRILISDEGYNEYLKNDYLDIKLMQYTGLKDKNGKEIYEGDILTADNEFIDGIVKWMDDRGCYYLTDQEGYATDSDHCYDGLEWNRLEVIGNIYENPELLESE